MDEIATVIKTERKRMGLTQEQFALRAGLGIRFVREVEAGKRTVRLDKLEQCLFFLGFKLGAKRVNE